MPPSPVLEAAQWAHGNLGNRVVADSLSGDMAGMSPVVAGEMASAAAGVSGQGEALGSNTAMLRAMRDSLALGDREMRAVNAIGSGGGKELPGETKDRMERAFGHDFSHVRVHTDGRAAAAADALQAHAFALGADIWFGSGEWAPGTQHGDRLLAHELTHVVQHDKGRLPTGSSGGEEGVQVSNPNEPSELEAYGNEDRILAKLGAVDREIRAEGEVETQVELAPGLAPTNGGPEGAQPAEAEAQGEQAEGPAMRDGHGAPSTEAAQGQIRNSRGAPLPKAVADRLSAVLGHDFSHVRIHVDDQAAKAADALNATAFAIGADIYFGQGNFSPGTSEGDRVLAHELTHVVQHDEGRLPTGGDGLEVSSPSDATEREAVAVADAAAPAMQSATPAMEGPSVGAPASAEATGTGIAMREEAPSGGATTSGGAPEKFELTLAGTTIELRLPEGTEHGANVRVDINRTPIPGITLKSAVVRFDDEWKIEQGTLTADVAIGEFVSATDTRLTIDREGNISASITGADLTVGEIVTGQMDLTVGSGGISGTVDLTHAEVEVQPGFTLSGGTLNLTLDTEGNVAAEGEITGTIDGLGTFVLNATLENTTLGGTLEITFQEGLQLGAGIVLESGTLTGSYTAQGTRLTGSAVINIRDVAEASISAQLTLPANEGGESTDGPSSAPASEGEAGEQEGEEAAAGPQGSGGAQAPSGGGAPQGGQGGGGGAPAEAAAEEAMPEAGPGEAREPRSSEEESSESEGEDGPETAGQSAIGLTLPVPGGGILSARGTLRQTAPLALGDVTVTQGVIGVTIADNVLTSVTASCHYVRDPVEGDITGTYDPGTNQVSGTGTAQLTRPVPVGDTGAVITEAHGEITVTNNVPTQIVGGLTAIVPYEGQPTFEIRTNDDVTIDLENLQISGVGTVTTLRPLTFGPEDGKHIVVQAGASATGTVENNALKGIDGGLEFQVTEPAGEIGTGTLSLTINGEGAVDATATFDLTARYGIPDRAAGPVYLLPGLHATIQMTAGTLETMTLENGSFEAINPDGPGKVEGTFAGSMSFETGLVTGGGTVSVAEDWPLTVGFGTFTFVAGGSIEADVNDSVLTKLDGRIPYTADITVGAVPVLLEGEANGLYESKLFNGSIEGHLRENLVLPLENGDEVVVLEGSSITANVENNALSTIDFTVNAEYKRAGELFLSGTVPNGVYTVSTGAIDFEGELTLKKQIEKQTDDGKWKLVILEDSKVNAKVEASNLTELGGDIKFQVHDTEPLLDGEIKGAVINVKDMKVSGTLDVKTARNFDHPRQGEDDAPPGFQFRVKQGSGVSGTITENRLTSLKANLDFVVNQLGSPLAEGRLDGDWNMVADEFTGGGIVTLVRPFPLGSNTGEGGEAGAAADMSAWETVIRAGSGVELKIEANKLQKAHVELGADVKKGGETYAAAQLSGDYKLGEEKGFSGTASIDVVKRIPWSEGTRFHYHIDVGTHLEGAMSESKIQSASGTGILAVTEGDADKVKVTLGINYTRGAPLSGNGTVEVVDDIRVATRGEYVLFLAEGSGGTAEVANNDLKSIGGTIKLRLDQGTTPLVKGDFTAKYEASEGENANITGAGEISVLNDIPIDRGEFKYVIEPSTSISASIANSALEKIDGNLEARVEQRQGGAFLDAHLDAHYVHSSKTFSGTGSVEVTRELDVGAVAPPSYRLKLVPGAGAQVDVQNNALQTISANVPLRIDDAEGQLVSIKLNGTYNHPNKKFDGTGTASLLRRVTVAQNVAPDNYSFYLEPASEISATVAQNKLTQVGGTLNASVHDGQGQFLTATGGANWASGPPSLMSITGSATITRAKQLATVAGGYTVWLVPGSGADIAVTNNVVDRIGGNITIRVDKNGQPFANVTLSGSYTKADGFNGKGTATLIQEVEVGQMGGGYALYVEPGTGAEVTLAKSEVTNIGGTIKLRLNEAGTPFIRGDFGGDYRVKEKKFTGRGTATVLREKQLATLGSEQLFLAPGSGASIGITNNTLTEVGGNLVLRMKDAEGPYVDIRLRGSFDVVGGTGFTGDGGATVTREKKLFQLGDYKFYLGLGGGATAYVNQNKLTKVEGNVPFVIHDATGPLITGSAGGSYDSATGKLNGTGDVRLARDVDFNVGGGTVIKFKAGSGGNGTVKDSKLEKLGGTLTAELWKDGIAMVRVTAAGEYDAVRNKLKRLEGSATLLQPIRLLGGKLIISNVTGNALIVDNKLVRAGGSGAVSMPDFGNTTGTFAINWSNETGTDVYSGTGTINFRFLEDPAQGRYMAGSLSATYNSDNTFNVAGNLHYQMNENIGGDLAVEMDQTLDPLITNASMTANGTMVPGRDLFRMEKYLVPHQSYPIAPFPVGIGFGVKGGLALAMQPLTYNTTIGISNWRPLKGDVPTFHADLALNWGLNFEAMLAAYLTLDLTVGVASVGAGVRGEARLNVPLNIAPYGVLEGGPDGFAGELGVGISITPSITLSAIPFVHATVTGIDPITHDFPGASATFNDLFSFEWNTSYGFGDRPVRRKGAAPQQAAQAPTVASDTQTINEDPPAFGNGGGGGGSAGPASSAPQMESGSEIAGQQPLASGEGAGEGPMAGIMSKIEDIKTLAAGIGALGELVGLIVSFVTVLLTFGPVGLGLYLIWKVICGDLSISRLTDQVNKVVAMLQTAGRLLRPYLPRWFTGIVDFINDPPSLYDMLFGADDAARASVRSGEWREAVPDLQARMAEDMLSGWTGEDDQECILILLEGPNTQAIVSRCGAGWILDDLDGYEDTRAREIFRAKGISYMLDGSAGGEQRPGAAADHIGRSMGQPLPAQLAEQFGQAMNADFSAVQIHTDADAAAAAAAMGARAFMLGEHIYFGPGQSPDDAQLLGHELAHVAQLHAGELPMDGGISGAGMAAETDADTMAAKALETIASGEPAAAPAAAEGPKEAVPPPVGGAAPDPNAVPIPIDLMTQEEQSALAQLQAQGVPAAGAAPGAPMLKALPGAMPDTKAMESAATAPVTAPTPSQTEDEKAESEAEQEVKAQEQAQVQHEQEAETEAVETETEEKATAASEQNAESEDDTKTADSDDPAAAPSNEEAAEAAEEAGVDIKTIMRSPAPGAASAPPTGAGQNPTDGTTDAQDRQRAQAAFAANAGGSPPPAPRAVAGQEVPAAPPVPGPAPAARGASPAPTAAPQVPSSGAAAAAGAATPAVIPEAADVKGTMANFVSAPPSQQAGGWPTMGSEMGEKAASEHGAFQEAIPEYHAKLEGMPESGASADVPSPSGAPTVGDGPQGDTPEAAIAPTPAPGTANANPNAGAAVRGTPADASDDQKAANTARAIRSVQTADGAVNVSPGPTPDVPTVGASDPSQITSEMTQGMSEADGHRIAAQQAVIASPGSELVQPQIMDEINEVAEIPVPAVEETPVVPDMQTFLDKNPSADVVAAFDTKYGAEMQSSLQSARGELDTAVDTRDADQQAELDRADAEAKRMVEEAQTEQEGVVAEQRGKIEAERASTIQAQELAIADVEREARTEEGARQREINSEISRAETRVASEFTRAEREAAAEVTRGERQAAEEKRKAEEEAKNKSWWERAVDFVADAIAAIADAINRIFDAIRSAITSILDAVKDLANTIIDAAVSFICDAIAAFGELLKGLIQGLLGDIFPGLADALCSFVDAAVDFAQEQVRAIGEKLKEAVAAMCDAIQGALNAILNAFQGALNVALALAQAVITGDWTQVLLKILEAALQLAGISPDEFYSFIGRAEDTIEIIIDDPGAFIGNVISAVGQGFGQFGDNFIEHLQTGFVGWLTGQAGDAGITMPADPMSLGGVFDIGMQVLGLTYDNLREKAVEHLGEENVARLEFVWGFIDAALDGGWAGLWEHVSGYLDGLYDMVIGAIQNFLMERIVMAAVSKIATMWNPAGAIVQAIITAWNVYSWLSDQIQRIWGVVRAVVDGIGDVARGNIGGAANMVEGALADLVPVAIDLLANLLGLGGIGAKVREVIEGIRAQVDSALDQMIEYVKGMFSGGGEGEGEAAPAEAAPEGEGPVAADPNAPPSVVGEVIPFTSAGEAHRVFVDIQGTNATVMVASEVKPVDGHLADFERKLSTPEFAAKDAQARPLIAQARQLSGTTDSAADSALTAPSTGATSGTGSGGSGTGTGTSIVTGERGLADVFRELFEIFDDVDSAAMMAAVNAKLTGADKSFLATFLLNEMHVTQADIDRETNLQRWAREAWRMQAGGAEAWVRAIATAIGDTIALRKLGEIDAEHQSGALGKKNGFFTQAADFWLDSTNAGSDALYREFTRCVGDAKSLGEIVTLSEPTMHRVENAQSLYQYNGNPAWKDRFIAANPTLAALATTFDPRAISGNAVNEAVYAGWLDAVAAGGAAVPADLFTGSLRANVWWTPDERASVDHMATGGITGDAQFAHLCQVNALAPEWYPAGFVSWHIPTGTSEFRRPTVWDGMMSPLWVQQSPDAMAATGGGAAEVINQTSVPVGTGTRAAHVVTADLRAALQRAEAEKATNAYTEDPTQAHDGSGSAADQQVRDMQTQVATDTQANRAAAETATGEWQGNNPDHAALPANYEPNGTLPSTGAGTAPVTGTGGGGTGGSGTGGGGGTGSGTSSTSSSTTPTPTPAPAPSSGSGTAPSSGTAVAPTSGTAPATPPTAAPAAPASGPTPTGVSTAPAPATATPPAPAAGGLPSSSTGAADIAAPSTVPSTPTSTAPVSTVVAPMPFTDPTGEAHSVYTTPTGGVMVRSTPSTIPQATSSGGAFAGIAPAAESTAQRLAREAEALIAQAKTAEGNGDHAAAQAKMTEAQAKIAELKNELASAAPVEWNSATDDPFQHASWVAFRLMCQTLTPAIGEAEARGLWGAVMGGIGQACQAGAHKKAGQAAEADLSMGLARASFATIAQTMLRGRFDAMAGHPYALWSGGEITHQFATGAGYQVLERTQAGQLFDNLVILRNNWDAVSPLWQELSRQYAMMPPIGDIHCFQRWQGGVFAGIEKPTLESRAAAAGQSDKLHFKYHAIVANGKFSAQARASAYTNLPEVNGSTATMADLRDAGTFEDQGAWQAALNAHDDALAATLGPPPGPAPAGPSGAPPAPPAPAPAAPAAPVPSTAPSTAPGAPAPAAASATPAPVVAAPASTAAPATAPTASATPAATPSPAAASAPTPATPATTTESTPSGTTPTGATEAAAEPTTPAVTPPEPVVQTGTMSGEGHTLRIKPASQEVTLASVEGPATTKLDLAIAQLPAADPRTPDARAALTRVRSLVHDIETRIRGNAAVTTEDLRGLGRQVMAAIAGYGSMFNVKDIAEPLPSFPGPIVGAHPVTGAAGPDGKSRESHHVPAKELANRLVEELTQANATLAGSENEAFQDAADRLLDVANQIRGMSEGAGLTAILLHPVTHKNADGTAVHSSAMVPLILSEMEAACSETGRQRQQCTVSCGERLGVNPRSSHWREFIALCRAQVEAMTADDQATQADSIVDQSEAELTLLDTQEHTTAEAAALAAVRQVLRNSFDDALSQGYAAVSAALSVSFVDGTAEEKSTALGGLRQHARGTWNYILNAAGG